MKLIRLLGFLLTSALTGCQREQPAPVPVTENNSTAPLRTDESMDIASQRESSRSGKPFTTQDLDRIERELKIKLPGAYKKFMLARSQELFGYTYPLRGQTELWFDWEFFGFNVDRLISENTGQRRPDMAAGAAFPGWWKSYFFFGSNGGGDYYAMQLDGTPGVWFLACDAGTVQPYVDSLEEYVERSLKRYPDERKNYERLENLYQRKLRGEIEEAEFEKQWQEIIASPLPTNESREASEELFEAINSGQLELLQQMVSADPGLLRATRIGGRTALHQAAFSGEYAMVEWLIKSGADVNARTDYGWTALHYAAAPEDESAALLLIEHGAPVNAANDDGDTPLHFAASFGKLKMAKALLEENADLAAMNQAGQSPLQVALGQEWEPMIHLLSDK